MRKVLQKDHFLTALLTPKTGDLTVKSEESMYLSFERCLKCSASDGQKFLIFHEKDHVLCRSMFCLAYRFGKEKRQLHHSFLQEDNLNPNFLTNETTPNDFPSSAQQE
jgi:hypothetical protein